ncbi:MAG: hypothetical protein V2J55_11965, partial [Candidatus Competibacteraceae bacterium]|nr:hypothetical protein [Candidatus Competibacteraceae bacterium]
MRASFSDKMNPLISRLLIARKTGHASTELVDEVLALLPCGLPVTERRAARDALIREAARLIPGSP